MGVFSVPYEKTALFLTASDGQDPAAPSGLSDERSRRQSLREEFWPRWQKPDLAEQLETSPFLKLEHKIPPQQPRPERHRNHLPQPLPSSPHSPDPRSPPSPSQPMLEAPPLTSVKRRIKIK